MAEKFAVVTGAKLHCPSATCPPEAAPDFVSTNDLGFNIADGASASTSDNVVNENIFPFPGKCTKGGLANLYFQHLG